MRRVKFQFKETIATLIGEEEFINVAQEEIIRQRCKLEHFILQDPFFQVTFEPYHYPSSAPEIVKRMSDAASKAGVGPMAAVAGAIGEFAVEAMIEAGAQHAIIDNGGDIAMYLAHPITVGIYTGGAMIKNMGLRIEPQDHIIGICTSSGKVGHSISFGNAHAATVISKDVALADASATALGNAIQEEDEEKIRNAMNKFKREGIEGTLVVIGNYLGMSGNVSPLLSAKMDYDLIAMG